VLRLCEQVGVERGAVAGFEWPNCSRDADRVELQADDQQRGERVPEAVAAQPLDII
jgi:hypothetical protein